MEDSHLNLDEIKLSASAKRQITELVRNSPPICSGDDFTSEGRKLKFTKTTHLHDSLGQKHPCVPPCKKTMGLYSAFPAIHTQRDSIVDAAHQHKAVAFLGDNVQEKSLCIPQFVLESYAALGAECLVLVVKGDDVLAMDAAARLAEERGEKVGGTVGYKVSHDSQISSATCLIFCTPHVILHTLAARNSNLIQGVTHLMLDDVHLRSMYLELAMITLKDILIRYERLKLLMNLPTSTSSQFQDFFEPREMSTERLFGPKFVMNLNVGAPHRPAARVLHLEDFISSPFFHCKMQSALLSEAEKWEFVEKPSRGWEKNCTELDRAMRDAYIGTPDPIEVDLLLRTMLKQVDACNVNHAHPDSSMTPLMIAAARNHRVIVEELIRRGADIRICTLNGWTALDWAVSNHALDTVRRLQEELPCESLQEPSDVEIVEQKSNISGDLKRRLCSYFSAHTESSVDHKAVALLISHEISKSTSRIIVFIPGIDDTFEILDYLESSDVRDTIEREFKILMLHENLDMESCMAYERSCKAGKRILFSIGKYEYNIMMEDVGVVIDTGKDRTVVFDHLNGRSRTEDSWICQQSADQRASLANGVCYRMYTRVRLEEMKLHRAPDIIRRPLESLCLWVKMLAPAGNCIEEYLSLLPEQPRPFSVKVAVTFLKAVEALTHDTSEITELGFLMLNLPVEPKVAKLILLGLAFRCLDPVLTIASAHVVQNVINVSTQKVTRSKILQKKNQLAQQSFSDHSATLKAMLVWLKAREKENTTGSCSPPVDVGFLNHGRCELAFNLRSKLVTCLDKLGLLKSQRPDLRDLNLYSDNFSMVRAVLCCAFFPNILRVQWEKKSILSFLDQITSIAKQSILYEHISRKMNDNSVLVPSNWFLYSDSKKLPKPKTEISDLTCLSALTVSLFSGHTLHTCKCKQVKDSPDECVFQVVEWIQFLVSHADAELLFGMRHKIRNLVGRNLKLQNDSDLNVEDTRTLDCLSSILREEDKRIGLKLISGCAQRSRPISIPLINLTPDFPAGRNRIRCDFCDSHPLMGAELNPKHEYGSCLRKSCLEREQKLFQKRYEEQKLAELESKATKTPLLQSKKGLIDNGQTSLLGPLPTPHGQSSDYRHVTDQHTRNLYAGQFGRYLPQYVLANLTTLPNLAHQSVFLPCIRNNEYINPYYESSNKLPTASSLPGLDYAASCCVRKQRHNSSSLIQQQQQSDLVTCQPPAAPAPTFYSDALRASVATKPAESESAAPAKNTAPAPRKAEPAEAGSYTLPPATGRPWSSNKTVSEMSWRKLEESWIGFSSTWKSSLSEKQQPPWPWLDLDDAFASGSLPLYPTSLIDPKSGFAGNQWDCSVPPKHPQPPPPPPSLNPIFSNLCNEELF